MKTTLAQDCIFNDTSLHLIHPQLLQRHIYFCIDIFGVYKWNIFEDPYVPLQIHVAFHGWQLDILNIGRFPDGHCRIVKRFSNVPGEYIQILDMVRCPADVIVPSMTIQNAVRASWNFNKYLNFTRHRTMTFYRAILPGAVRYYVKKTPYCARKWCVNTSLV